MVNVILFIMIFVLLLSYTIHNDDTIRNKKAAFNAQAPCIGFADIIIFIISCFILFLFIFNNDNCNYNKSLSPKCLNYIKTNITITSWNCDAHACGKYYITDNIYLCKVYGLHITQDNINKYPIKSDLIGYYNYDHDYNCAIKSEVDKNLKNEIIKIKEFKFTLFIFIPCIFSTSIICSYILYISNKYTNQINDININENI